MLYAATAQSPSELATITLASGVVSAGDALPRELADHLLRIIKQAKALLAEDVDMRLSFDSEAIVVAMEVEGGNESLRELVSIEEPQGFNKQLAERILNSMRSSFARSS